ncbi:uncharacterized protein LOC134289601 [Aedes albopictus]|uniref:DUF7083 domain-containing protein n=1 Tax=Aedes albopictus TaxID=7160 RepID=A0ABM1Z1L5_AEDAL
MSNNGVVPGVWVIVNSELKSEESIARWVGIGSTDRLMKVSGDQGAYSILEGTRVTPDVRAHRLITQLSHQISATQLGLKEISRDDVALNALANNINEFRYAPEEGCTFDSWYARYSELFDQDAKKLDDSAKVRLLMRKLNPAAHERYTIFILPKQSNEFTFSEIVEKLKLLFGSPVSIFHRRYQCLQTVKDDTEDIVAYSCKANRACVDFKIAELSEEQFKSLIFLCGLKSSKDSDIRMRLITKLNESSDITLTKILEDCRSLMNLKNDNVLVEKQSSSSVHASTCKYNNK